MSNIPTPHINAKKEDIAKIVLMPGDPLRAKKIAETYLEDYRLVNEVRNMFMYTGTYKGVKVTVAGSGMGCPSIGIYSYELFKFYDVDYIIRVGSAGSYNENINVYDIFNAKEAFGESNYAKIAANIDSNIIEAGQTLFNKIEEVAKRNEIKTHVGRCHSSDVFYRYDDSMTFAKENGLDVVEMESYALFSNAIVTGKQAACLLTISDSFITNEATTAEERQNNFMQMIELALETSLELK
ncbi:purine-nucleoside phosphorylase [Spiroplasma monobiae]|uniref:Uridine phosphorylase n=1 Tax=Spiroplasma monobiae MQ-1 TaxID=1336748 RepID=A0A2K9LTK9_SPISQ|nr:purine-nucleoside phosphorylase [Spiroplasma monobiae]AUM62340.1 purine nucleoside phosphorylase [Spiroplasma monobiae MQ-1]